MKEFLKKNKALVISFVTIVAVFLIFAVWWIVYLHKAHSTFENYYAFRGCVQLVERTDTYGICKIGSGETIKIVKFQGKWFLDGDLPTCWFFGKCI
jgi:hypothetical protein